MKILSTALALILLTACSSQTGDDAGATHDAGTHTHDDAAQVSENMPTATEAMAHSHHNAGDIQMTMTVAGDQRCIISNGVPQHQVGTWRPGAVVEAQDHKFCVDATPQVTDTITRGIKMAGMTVTGIPLRPGTAEYYDPTTELGWFRDRPSAWNVEGIGGLRMDDQNAHVDGDGMYHYHGIPKFVTDGLEDTLFAYAADGFEIHYLGDKEQSSWQLRKGERDSGPGGAFDGTYEQDYEFVATSGTLDECNGAVRDGQYRYFATNTYPFFPRCFRGTIINDERNDRPERGEGRPISGGRN